MTPLTTAGKRTRNANFAHLSPYAVLDTLTNMAYDELLERRVRQFFEAKRIKPESKRMMGGLCFMVNGRMCVGVEKNRLMARIGPDAYDDALTRKGCRPMDFTGRPMRGFVFVGLEGLRTEKDLAFWMELALSYNPLARKSAKSKRKSVPDKLPQSNRVKV